MHQFLRSVGFSKITTKKQLKTLLNDVIVNSTSKEFLETEDGYVLVEYTKNYSDSCGITLRGEYDEDESLTLDYYYPHAISQIVSTNEDVTFERHKAHDSYAGSLEDVRVGVSMIFYVRSALTLNKKMQDENYRKSKVSTSFSGLSTGGAILLPILKNPVDKEKIKRASLDRNKRIMAAKNGDEEAIEQLTIEDIDTYSAVSKRILKDDVFTLVDSYFMPYGIECDHYSVMAEIENVKLEENYLSGEKIYILDLNCNNLQFTVCINSIDLIGEPLVGRRFRGNIWLQGLIS